MNFFFNIKQNHAEYLKSAGLKIANINCYVQAELLKDVIFKIKMDKEFFF